MFTGIAGSPKSSAAAAAAQDVDGLKPEVIQDRREIVSGLTEAPPGQPGRGAPISALPLGPLVHLHRITSHPGRGLLTIRPDGYVGLRCQRTEPERLTAWLNLIRAPRPEADPRAA